MDVFAFEAVLVPSASRDDWPAERVTRTVALRGDRTLEQPHEALRLAMRLKFCAEVDPGGLTPVSRRLLHRSHSLILSSP